jgi:arylsulfatase A-like enzyme
MRNRRPNVILLVLDTLRADRLSCYGYDDATTPTLDRLSEDGLYFERAYTTGPWTVPVHSSIFTGKMPSEHGSHRQNKQFLVESDETLAGKLTSAGYDTVGFSANPWITPEFGYNAGFDSLVDLTPSLPFPNAGDPHAHNWEQSGNLKTAVEYASWCLNGDPFKRFINGVYTKFFFDYPITPAKRVNDRVMDWLTSRDTDTPFFAFINYMDAHEPYKMRSSHLGSDSVTHNDLDGINRNRIGIVPSPDNPGVISGIYDASVTYLDAQIGALLTELKQRDELDQTILIVLGDHGQSLGEHGYWGHGTYLYDELIRIPLIVSGISSTQRDSSVVNQRVSLVDLPRFICDIVGTEFDDAGEHTFTGVLSNSQSGPLRPAFAESHGPRSEKETEASQKGYRSIYYGKWRGVRNLDTNTFRVTPYSRGDEAGLSESEAPNVLERLEDEYVSQITPRSSTADQTEISVEREQMLQDLGYMQ